MLQMSHSATNNIWEEGQDAFLPLRLMLGHITASHLKVFHGDKQSSQQSSPVHLLPARTRSVMSKLAVAVSRNRFLHAPCKKMSDIFFASGNHAKGVLQSRKESSPSQEGH